MKLAFGKMAMTPDTFWSMSLKEWECAYQGFVEFHSSSADTSGEKRQKPIQHKSKNVRALRTKHRPISVDEFEALMKAADGSND